MQTIIQYKKSVFVLILIILLGCIYYFMFMKNDTITVAPAPTPEPETKDESTNKVDNIVAETKSNSSIISLKDVENYSLVTDGNISLSLAEDDTYLME